MKSIILKAMLALSLICLASIANADLIQYQIDGTLIQVGGNNDTGLDGAQFSFTTQFDTTAPYIDRFSFPAIAGIAPTVDISGASVSGNNGILGVLNGAAFYPSFAGVFSEPGGGFMQIALPGTGDLVEFGLFTNATASGSAAVIGGTPIISDFVPATVNSDGSGGITRFLIGGVATYDLANSRITAFKIPEPSSFAVVSLGLAGLIVRRRKV